MRIVRIDEGMHFFCQTVYVVHIHGSKKSWNNHQSNIKHLRTICSFFILPKQELRLNDEHNSRKAN